MTVFQKILLVRTDRIGDLLMNVPVMRRLRQNFPKSYLTVLAHEASAPVLSRQPDIDEVLPVSDGLLATPAGRWDLARRLRSRRFDCAVVSNPAKFLHFAAWFGGIPVRAGYGRKWGFFLNRRIPDRKAAAGRHEIDSNLELLDAFCPQAWDGTIDLGFRANASETGAVLRRFGLEGDRRIVAVHLGTSDPRKEWPLSQWGEVIGGLARDGSLRVVLVGASLDAARRASLGLAASPDLLDLTGRTTLPELAVLLGQSALLVSTDSGPYHLAWMQGASVVGLFVKAAGGSSPGRWGVYPGFAKCVEIHKAADEIRPAEVLDAIHRCLHLLSTPNPRG